MNLPPGWTIVGGLPCYADGEWCAMAYAFCDGYWPLKPGRITLYRKGIQAAYGDDYDTHSPAHFAAAEKLLRDHQQKEAERDIEEVFRSEHVTVFRRNGLESFVHAHPSMSGYWCWHCVRFESRSIEVTRPEAEAAAKKALMEAAK